MVEYLDKTGLAYLWNKIKSHLATKLAQYVTIDSTQTVSGVKTFSNLSYSSNVYAPTNTVIEKNSKSVIQSPIPKYLWHDLLAFVRQRGTYNSSFYDSADGSTWTSSNFSDVPFIQKDGGTLQILNSTKFGARWVFSSVAWCSAEWLLISFTYNVSQAKVTIKVEKSSDNSTWTVIHNSSFKPSVGPWWLKLAAIDDATYLRITITKETSDSGSANISAIRLLTSRWGDQGGGSEYEYPFNWDTNLSITPIGGSNLRSLGTSSLKWKGVYATTFYGALDGNATTATKATQDSSGNNIEATYQKKADVPAAITNTEMDNVLEDNSETNNN